MQNQLSDDDDELDDNNDDGRDQGTPTMTHGHAEG